MMTAAAYLKISPSRVDSMNRRRIPASMASVAALAVSYQLLSPITESDHA
jgi:hypothetical protein